MQIPAGKKIYFLSDFHLGTPSEGASLEREKKIVRFLDGVKAEAFAIFLVGDLFDFWYEYRTVVPRGYVRLLGKMAELSDAGIQMHLFVGNHDMWMKTYFQKEFNIPVYFEPRTFEFNNCRFLVGHGDGLGPGDHGYKALKKVFRNPVCQWLFGLCPPAIGMGLANYFSRRSRAAADDAEEKFWGEGEWLIVYSREKLKEEKFHYFVFGHRHLPIDFRLTEESRYINLGDWLRYFTYAVFDGQQLDLRSYGGPEHLIVRKD